MSVVVVKIRLIGETEAAANKALDEVRQNQRCASLQNVSGPRRGHKGGWLVYADLVVSAEKSPSPTKTKAPQESAKPPFGSVGEAVKFLLFVAESRHWEVDYSNDAALETVIAMAKQSASSPAQLRLVEAAMTLIKGQ